MAQVTWLPIPEWEGMYEVSDDGRVRSVDRRVMTANGPRTYRGQELQCFGKRYPRVLLSDVSNGRSEKRYVHDLVMLAFVGPKPEGHCTLHFNDDGFDNRLENLRYGSYTENLLDGLRNREHVGQTPEERMKRHVEYKRRWRAARRANGLPVL